MKLGKPLNLSTGGVHPLVRASMLPRIKAVKATGLGAQSEMLRGLAKPRLTRAELSSRRNLVGRLPRG